MKKRIVRTENYTHEFQETNDIRDVIPGGVTINGYAETVTQFVQEMRLEQDWIPHGYCLRKVLRISNSKNMTAYLYRIGEKF